MAEYTFKSEPVYNPTTDQVVENATGGIFCAVADGAALPIYDLNGTPIANITSNASGMSRAFTADQYQGFIQFGSLAVPVVAQEVAGFAVNAQGAIDTANNALAIANQALASGGGGGGGVTSHGALSGLSADDHPQYLTQARGDARYDTTATVDSKVSSAVAANSAGDRNRTNHTGTQTQSTVTGLVSALSARAEVVSVTTGSETRPIGSTVVIWICPVGVNPANAAGGDLIFQAST